MNEQSAFAPVPLVFVFAAILAWSGWYHFFKAQAICDKMAEKWPRFLARAYSSRVAYFMYKGVGVASFLMSLVVLSVAVRRLMAH